jgi:hypothetical protein
MHRSRGAAKTRGGRPARGDAPQRLVVRVAGDLKRWLAHRAIDEGRDMGRIVSDALVAYRKSIRGKP